MSSIARLLNHPGLEGTRPMREEVHFQVDLAEKVFGTFPSKAFANSYAAQVTLLDDAVYSLASGFLMA